MLELLSEGDLAAAELAGAAGVEADRLPQDLAALRRAGLVTARAEGGGVRYALADPQVAELLAAARRVLTGLPPEPAALLRDRPTLPRPVTAHARPGQAHGA